jgi:hypothetical protein
MVLVTLAACLLTHSALAQLVTRSVGSPTCNAYDDLDGVPTQLSEMRG